MSTLAAPSAFFSLFSLVFAFSLVFLSICFCFAVCLPRIFLLVIPPSSDGDHSSFGFMHACPCTNVHIPSLLPHRKNPSHIPKKRTPSSRGRPLTFLCHWILDAAQESCRRDFLRAFCFLFCLMLVCYIPPVSGTSPLFHTPLYFIFLHSFPYCLAGFSKLGRPRGKNIISRALTHEPVCQISLLPS